MSRFLLIVISSLILQACTPSENLPTPTSTHEITITKTPTKIPSTPTETPDPDMPTDATGKNNQGKWIKETTEMTFTWREFIGELSIVGWTSSHGSGNLVEQNDDTSYLQDSVPIEFVFFEGVKGPYFNHPDERKSPNFPVSGLVLSKIYSRLKQSYSRVDVYDSVVKKQGIPIKIVHPTGGEFIWQPSPSVGVKFLGVSVDYFNSINNPRISKWKTKDFENPNIIYHWTFFTDKQNNLIIVGAMENTEIASPKEWMTLALSPITVLLESEKVDSDIGFFASSQMLVSAAIEGTNPYFETTTNP